MQRIVIGTGEELPFPDASFDLVVSLWTFEHVKEPLSVFREIARVLRPGGVFAFVAPNKRSLLIRLRTLMNKRTANILLERFYGRKDDDVFDVFYRANTVGDIARLAKQAGLAVSFLKENEDPSYTSFGFFSYVFSK